jgi:pimeloyl-ACP methyl ester carboxylesterase
MSTQQTALTQYVDVDGIKFAYRRFGNPAEVPLVLLMHFRGTMDHWDPDLINALAHTREVILLDNSGVGKSSGSVPDNYGGWAQNVINLLSAIGVKKIDLLGFSMGGFVAQLVTLKAPELVRRLILAGTGPSAGEGVTAGPPEAFELIATATPEGAENAHLKTFYSLSDEKQALGKTWWKRINERNVEPRSPYVGKEGVEKAISAAIKWGTGVGETSYDRLGEIKIPVFVANGDIDILVPTANSFVLKNRLPNAHLHIYPDTGHGFLFEYASIFVQHVNIFLA